MPPAAVQEVPPDAPVSPAAADVARVILDTGTPLNRAYSLAAGHFLTLDRVEAVTASLTTFPPDDDTGWAHLGERAWVAEWLRPGTSCSILPPPGAGPEAALTMPWMSPRAREAVCAVTDIDLLPPEAAQDRRELTALGIRSLVISSQVADGVMFGSFAVGSSTVGPWPESDMADVRLVSVALTSRIALEQAQRSLADAVAVGARSRESQQHFMASIGHELRTPLTAIIGYTEMLVDEAAELDDEPFAAVVSRDGQVILRACEQLMAVLQDLLSAGRAVGETDLRERVDIEAAVADVIHWHRAAAGTVGVRLSSTVMPGHTVWAHPVGLRQVLANLIGNAIVHNVEHGSVEVSTATLSGESGEARLRVIVRDTGPGLAPDQLSHAFEPFVRFARPGAKGTGLGLSLSRTIAERDGGTIGAESTPGVGSAFWLELPVDEAGHRP